MSETIRAGAVVKGALFPEPVQVIVCTPMGAAVKLIGKGLDSGKVYEPILAAAQLASLAVSPDRPHMGRGSPKGKPGRRPGRGWAPVLWEARRRHGLRPKRALSRGTQGGGARKTRLSARGGPQSRGTQAGRRLRAGQARNFLSVRWKAFISSARSP